METDVAKLEKEICLFLATPFDFHVGKYNGGYHGNIRTMEHSKLLFKRRMSVTRAIYDFRSLHGNDRMKIEDMIEHLIFFSETPLNYKTLETIQTLAAEVIYKYNEKVD